ncbi:MAG: methyltransferase [Amaricoccus sp.]|uniref:methyltransferase family protein n=1 Tax=Amaricoccus sp. TaxID=1872485 RepID=UPI0039E69312
MFLSETMRRSPHPGFWRLLGLLAFVPLAFLAATRAEPIEAQVGPFWGEVYETACILLVIAGLGVRAGLAGCHPLARDELDASGFYSMTRNPVYLANSLIMVGIILYTQDLVLGVACALWLAVYYERTILAEEARLFRRFGIAFVGWASLTPVFLPRLAGWRPPAAPLNLRAIMRREPMIWFGATAAMAAIATVSDMFGDEPMDDTGLMILVAAALVGAGISLVSRQAGLLDDPDL